MVRHPILRSLALAASSCLLLIAVAALSLFWASRPPAVPASIAPPTGQPAVLAIPARSGNRLSALLDSVATARAVREAWQRARDAGVYRFATDLTQLTYPARTLSNSGRGPQTVELHLEGEVDQPARTMGFRLWQPDASGSGSAANGVDGRVDGDRVYVRGADGSWQEVEDFTANFAPDNDPLAFLGGMVDVQEAEPLARAPTHPISRFTFNLDGPKLANYLRDRLVRYLTAQGELPPGVDVDVSASMRRMDGNGELWVDEHGLPLRLTMHLVFPPQTDGSQVEADILTGFSGFPQDELAGPVTAAGSLHLPSLSLPANAGRAAAATVVLACSLLVTLLLISRRSRRLYATVVITLILSMVVAPQMQSARVAAFYDRQAARAQELRHLTADGQALDDAAMQGQQDAYRTASEALAPPWDPLQDPLAEPAQERESQVSLALPQPQATPPAAESAAFALATPTPVPTAPPLDCDAGKTGDTDGDGVNDYEECVYSTYVDDPDSDNDGLTDGEELNKLATYPSEVDSDGDAITDTVEVQGFPLGGRTWYLNPNNADTNNDGIVDSAECPALVEVHNPGAAIIAQECDSDKDNIPNPFEFDNDNDGVPDAVDLSPDDSVTYNGKGYGPATAATAFNNDRPFRLAVTSLTAGYPVLLDIQLRPLLTDHLYYAYNVLDWPANDVDGQIQHQSSTTFFDLNPKDTAGAQGDIRLIPLLQIGMTGELPLKLTTPKTSVIVGKGTAVSSTVTLEPATATSTSTLFKYGLPANARLLVYHGTCPNLDAQALITLTGTSGTLGSLSVVQVADGNHALVITGTAVTTACVEIPDVVNGMYSDKMVDESPLAPYGISLKDEGDGSVVANVPLNAASDDTGAGRSAFQARMIYWPGAANRWAEAQTMKVVWLVQMITDDCAPGAKSWEEYQAWYQANHAGEEPTQADYDKYIDDWCAKHRTADQVRPVQIYDEDWYLTGLTVREDHGLDIAVAYPNPTVSPYDDDALYELSLGLGEQFLTGVDCRNAANIYSTQEVSCTTDNLRDVGVTLADHAGVQVANSTIEGRFDITATLPITTRWGISLNALYVETFPYDHQDYMVYHSMNQTPRILAQYSSSVTTTTILQAREERYREAPLAAGTMAQGAPLTLDLNMTSFPEITLAGMLWTPYRRVGTTWEAFNTIEYWDYLEMELGRRLRAMYPNDPPEVNNGRMLAARSYNMALINGVVNTVVHCLPNQLLCPIPGKTVPYTDTLIVRAYKDMQNGLDAAIIKVVYTSWKNGNAVRKMADMRAQLHMYEEMNAFDDAMQAQNGALPRAGNPEKKFYQAIWEKFKASTFASFYKSVWNYGGAPRVLAGVAVGAAVATLVATIIIASVLKVEAAQVAAIVIRSVALIIATHCMIVAIAGYVKVAREAIGSVWEALKAGRGWSKNVNRAGVATTALAVIMTWAAFGVLCGVNHLHPGSSAFAGELAYAIASTLVTVILFVVFAVLGTIGSIVQAIFGMIDAIARLICSALPEKAQKSEAAYWLCGGITGLITNFFKWLLYSGTVMVNMAPEDYERLEMYGFDTALNVPEHGVVAGNAIQYSISLTNTIDLVAMPVSPYLAKGTYGYKQWSDETLARSTFKYKWQEDDIDFESEIGLDGMNDQWNKTNGGRPYYYTATVWTPIPFVLDHTGINRTEEGLYLSEAYATPDQVCWAFDGCEIKTKKDTNHYDLGADLRYDVLPATLSGFYQLASTNDGWVLAWGQSGDLKFGPLHDADGDGLVWLEDPDDSKWDADGDTLSDAYEIQTHSNPLAVDSDNDGLSDLEEVRNRTDPTSADSDGEGLYDCQEIFHQVTVVGDSTARAACGEPGTWSGGWSVVYGTGSGGPLTTRVTPDPRQVDTEGDGLTDAQEMTYGYNPNAVSALNVLSLHSELNELASGVLTPTDGYVAPGQTLYYSATVKNQLDNRQAQGLLSTAATVLNTTQVLPRSFVLRPQAQAAISGNLSVPAYATSGTDTVTQVAGASIVNLQLESNEASLWLRFDDSPAATVFLDSSGADPPHDATCAGTGCVIDPAAGKVGGALKLSGTGYVRSGATVPNTGYSVSFWFKVDAAHSSTGVLFATEQTDRVRIYLNAGKVVVSSGTTVMTSARTYGDDLWHHVAHTDPGYGGSGQQLLYIDGVVAAPPGTRSDLAAAATAGLLVGGNATTRLVGAMDDVRLFQKVLTAAEVELLANQPLFHMDMDQTGGWADVSSYHTPIEDCHTVLNTCHPYGPTHDPVAVSGSSASLDGTQYLKVPAAPQVDLSGGRFTLSTWIYPTNHGDTRDTFPQAILGLNSGTDSAYPTLQRVGRKIRFSLGDNGAWHTPYESGDVLMVDQWNHVALTLDRNEDNGTLRLYVNGKLVDTKPFRTTDITEANSFEIGRSNDTGHLSFTEFQQDTFHDEGGLECHSGALAELCMAMNQTQVMYWKPGSCGENCPHWLGIDCPTMPAGVDFTGSVTLQLWEDDHDPLCGSAHNHADLKAGNDDDECEMTGDGTSSSTSVVLTTNDAGFDVRKYTYGGCNSAGYFELKYTHDSIPFYGRIDELQIFGQPLDQDAVTRLYLDPATLLHLPLDEAPGATAFENQSLDYVPASCSGSACPATGTSGRINQAAQFSSQGHTAIALGRSRANLLTGTFSVAAWIKPNSTGGTQRIVSTARTLSNNGWGFGLASGGLSLDHFGYGNSFADGVPLQAGRWTHVAAVVSAAYTVTFYVDGQMWSQVGHGGIRNAAADTDDAMWVGAGAATGQSSLSEFFDGQIDELQVFGIALTADQIQHLYQDAPVLHLRFDEAFGATQFADNANFGRPASCAAPGCPVTGEGVRGQVGLAAQFDGQDDRVTVADSAALRPATFSVGAWVKPMAPPANPTPGLVHELVGKWANGSTNYRLYMTDVLTPTLQWGCSGTDIKVASDTLLIEGHWNHIMGTFDGQTLYLYVNGIQHGFHRLAAASSCTSSAALEIGGKSGLSASQFFNGALDEVVVYNRALTTKQVRELYQYQSGWVEDRQPHEITVDADPPTAEILLENGSYLPNRRTTVGVIAGDGSSAVTAVELSVEKAGGTTTWSPAERCAESAGFPTGAWCPEFAPSGQAQYTLQARATDRVGHTGLSAPITVNVDDLAPDLYLTLESSQLVAKGSKGKKNHWTVHLAGTVKDRPIATGIAGSGVPDDGVRVTLRDADGRKVGEEKQVAPIANMAWSLDYTIPDAKADGCLSLVVEAVDRVANLVQTDAEQLARHTAVISRSIVLNASAPQVALDKAHMAGGRLGTDVIALSGAISARPALVHVEMTGGVAAGAVRARLTCQHGLEGSWYTLFDGLSGTLAEDTTTEWEGEIHQGSSCQVELTHSAASAAVSGVIEVCGTQVTSWSGSFTGSKTVPFVVLAGTCAFAGCAADSPVSGVAGVDVAFVPALPGSAFVNEVPPVGEVLHLPFEDTPDENGVLILRDVSGGGNNGSCGSGGCPSTGEPGPSGGAAIFDGTNDAVEVGSFGTFVTTTVSAWVLRTGATTARETIVSYKESASAGFVLGLEGQVPKFWVRVGSAWQSILDGSNQVALNQWVHLAGTYDGSTLRLYRNGVQVAEKAAAGSMTQATARMAVGSSNSLNQHWFPGAIDDVRVFDRALTAAGIQALYLGTGPVLDLAFEKEWAAGGDGVDDSSGWRHHGTVSSGADDTGNKAVSGQVGSYALSLDGVNDQIQVPNDAALNFATYQDFAVALWVKVDTQVDVRNTDNDIVEKWSGSGGYPYVIRYLGASGIIHAARWDGSRGPTLASTRAINDNQFHHVAFVKQGANLYLYLDGALDRSAIDTTTGDTTNSSPLYIGSRGNNSNYFKGTVDELRIYGRALLAQEVADLYHAGWQPATLAQSGNAVVSSKWTLTVPAGLEGVYDINMRGRDVAGHTGVINEPGLLWRGEADNLQPRVILCGPTGGTPGKYVTVAEDYNLTEQGFASPCAISDRMYFRSPWYVSAVPATTYKLFKWTAACQVTSSPTLEATACDTYGNCSTVGLTSGGACETILAAQAAAEQAAVARRAAVAASALGKSEEPFLTIAPATITGTHLSGSRTLEVTGLFTGSSEVSRVEVAIGASAGPAALSEPAETWPFTRTWSYAYLWPGDALPDGVTQTAVATATLASEPIATALAILTFDVVPPAPVTLTLTHNGVPVQPRTILREAAPDLALAWTPSADGSGLGGYESLWRVLDIITATTTALTHSPAGPLEAHWNAAEVQGIDLGLTSRDALGNERWQPFGRVLVDGPLTPDLLRVPAWVRGGTTAEAYLGWMDSGCTWMGTDERTARAQAGSNKPAQRFYATWDQQALRLAFNGSAWSGESDVFIYLDTDAGGTEYTFTPYPLPETVTRVFLPAQMGADRLIWIPDVHTARILHWEGTRWVTEADLSPEQFQLNLGLNGGQVDLYLPFGLLGLQAGDPLGLLAFATEEPQPDTPLRLWTTFPTANPVNSARSNPRAFLIGLLEGKGARMPLLHFYHWATLGDGVCPNGTLGGVPEEQNSDTRLAMTISADPPGATVTGVGGGVYWTGDPAGALQQLTTGLVMDMLNAEHAPLLDGQPITYTIRIKNEGDRTLKDAWLEFMAFGQLRLLDERADLGDLPPGGEATAVAHGVTDRSRSEAALAVALAPLYAAGHEPGAPSLEWAVAANRVDRGAPAAPGLNGSAGLVGPGVAWLSGIASDESGIHHIEAEILSPSGLTTTLTCNVVHTTSGYWSCPWNVAAANGGVPPADGAEFTVRLRAADSLGHLSNWTLPFPIRVDAMPPSVRLATQIAGALAGRIVSSRTLRLMGDASDNTEVGSVTLCLEGQTCRTADLSVPGSSYSRWSQWITTAEPMDYVTRTLTIRATDRLGNQMAEPMTFAVVFDNVPPVLTASQVRTEVTLNRTVRVLEGEVSDGGPGVGVSVRVKSPQGVETRLFTARDGHAWWFNLPAGMSGHYELWVDAEDVAGNVSAAGPFGVDGVCTNAVPVITGLSAEPVAGWPISLTLTAVLSNGGPDALPAGMRVSFAEGASWIGAATSTSALPAGESAAMSIEWATDSSRQYRITVTPLEPALEEGLSAAAALCGAPAPATFALRRDELPLSEGWNLVGARAQPYNQDVEVVQRGIDGDYAAILGYADGLLSYYPDRPQDSTLTAVDAGHGYWVRATSSEPISAELYSEPLASWWLAGETVTVDRPLPLAAGWNLIGYLPRASLPVTLALQSIAGEYAAVMGLDYTALSYYPDLSPESGYNTLATMKPPAGYWITASQAVVLQYPPDVETPEWSTPTLTDSIAYANRIDGIRLAEEAAGVRPTYTWMNLYGTIYLSGGIPAPAGSTVTALASGVVCGATVIVSAGHFGLLACYGDDETTPQVDGAHPGDPITLLLDGEQVPARTTAFNGRATAGPQAVVWTAHGDRWALEVGTRYVYLLPILGKQGR